jgi:hypothetical protein
MENHQNLAALLFRVELDCYSGPAVSPARFEGKEYLVKDM